MNTENDPDAKPKSRWRYHLCAVLAIIGGTLTLCTGFFFLMAPIVQDSAARMSSQSNLKQLSLAAHNCSDAMDRMPGPFLDGDFTDHKIPDDPARRLSWRVALLAYIEADMMYVSLNRSEPWDSPVNRPVTSMHYQPLADPMDGKTNYTPYRVFHDNGALWDSDPKRRLPLDKIPDGASNTILIAESTVQVPWAQFNEHAYDPTGSLPELGRVSRSTFLVAMADGSVRAVKKSVSANTLRAAITRAGGESLGPDW